MSTVSSLYNNTGKCDIVYNKRRQCLNNTEEHNLNITTYSFTELLALFDLDSTTISKQNIYSAKRRVMMMHPDKSSLPKEYFLFYKKALELIVEFYNEDNKMHKCIPVEPMKYHGISCIGEKDADMNSNSIQKALSVIPIEEFSNKFNSAFEREMAPERSPWNNEWFSDVSEPDIFKSMSSKITPGNMGSVFDNIRDRQGIIIKHKEVIPLSSGGVACGNLYNDSSGETEEYVSCDPFSQLKYEDLRKVHKDHTVFAVGERDFDKMHKYKSIEEYSHSRQNMPEPMSRVDAMKTLESNEEQWRQQMLAKEYEAKQRTMGYHEKSQRMLSSFLQIDK
jgi:hypothetical protein